MAIGIKKNIIELESTTEPSRKIQISAGECICSGDGNVTILSYGDDMRTAIYNLTKETSNKTYIQGKVSEAYTINGMSDAQIRFVADAYNAVGLLVWETGRIGLGINTNYATQNSTGAWGDPLPPDTKGFRGCGFYFFIDN